MPNGNAFRATPTHTEILAALIDVPHIPLATFDKIAALYTDVIPARSNTVWDARADLMRSLSGKSAPLIRRNVERLISSVRNEDRAETRRYQEIAARYEAMSETSAADARRTAVSRMCDRLNRLTRYYVDDSGCLCDAGGDILLGELVKWTDILAAIPDLVPSPVPRP